MCVEGHGLTGQSFRAAILSATGGGSVAVGHIVHTAPHLRTGGSCLFINLCLSINSFLFRVVLLNRWRIVIALIVKNDNKSCQILSIFKVFHCTYSLFNSYSNSSK